MIIFLVHILDLQLSATQRNGCGLARRSKLVFDLRKFKSACVRIWSVNDLKYWAPFLHGVPDFGPQVPERCDCRMESTHCSGGIGPGVRSETHQYHQKRTEGRLVPENQPQWKNSCIRSELAASTHAYIARQSRFASSSSCEDSSLEQLVGKQGSKYIYC